MPKTSYFLVLPLLVLPLAAVTGCSGDTTTIGPGPDAAAEAGDDGSTDSTSADTQPGDDSATPIPEGGGGDTGGDSGSACGSLTPRMACTDCCNTTYTAGAQAFYGALFQCACAPAICGPTEAGAPDGGDAGSLGTGACAATCTMQTTPDVACGQCAFASLGTMVNPGPCRQAETTACTASADCINYVGCLGTCPK